MKVNRKNLLEAIEAIVDENFIKTTTDKVSNAFVEKGEDVKNSVKEYAKSMIESNESDEDFQTLMNIAANQDEGRGIQALEMMFAFELTEHQIRSIYNVALYNALEHNIDDLLEVLELRPPEYTDKEMAVHRDMAYKAIVTKSEQPERLLKAMNFDFHNEFAKVYGITPPRNMEFDFRSGADASGGLYHEDGVYLELTTLGGLIMFTFAMEGSHESVPTDPLIYLKNKKGDEVWMDIDTAGNLRYDTEQGETGLSKEEIPDLIRKHMGYATTEPVEGWKELPLGSAAPIREGYSSVSDTYQRGELDRWIRKARSISSPLYSELAKLKKKLDYGDFDDNRDWVRAKEIARELDQPQKQEPKGKKYVKPAPCLSAKEEWARMLVTLEGDINKNWLDRVLSTTRDEIALFGWGWILKKATQAAGGAFGWQYGGPTGALIVQELIDFAWNAAPRIIEDMAFRPQKAWGKPNVIEMFPILDQFDLDEAIYNLISPDAIGIIAKSYAEEVNEFILSNPDACMDEIPEINDYYTDWLRANPDMMKIMSRKTSGRKYTRPFRLTRESLFDVISEVLREDEDDMGIEKKINDFIASKDLESFNTGLSLLDTFEMSGLVEPRKAKDLKMLMYKSAKENNLFLDDIGATYNFIMSDEFASSFSDEEMANVKSTIFDILHGTSLESFEKLIEWVAADPNVSIHRYSGSFDLFYIEDIPNQEFVDRVIGKFRELSGRKDFAVFSMADGPEIYIGDDAYKLVNFNSMVKDIFGFKPKSLPRYNFFVGAFTSEIGYGMSQKVDNSPMFDGKTVEYHFEIKNEMDTRWKLTIIFNDGFAGNMQIDYREGHDSYIIQLSQHREGYTTGKLGVPWVSDNPSEENFTRYNREGMINKVKEMTGIDLTAVGEVNESLTEIEENFGANAEREVLEEGWEDQWPSEFGALLRMIKSPINNQPDVFSEALVKIFYKVGSINYIMPIKFIRAAAYSIVQYADDGIKKHTNKIATYNKYITDIKQSPLEDFPQDEKDEQIAEYEKNIAQELKILNQYTEFFKLAQDDFYFGKGRRKEVLKQAKSIQAANPNDKLPAMRYSNKVIKSIIKQLNKWRDKNVTSPRVMVTVDAVIQNLPRSIKSASDWAYEKTFEGDLAVLIEFIKRLRGNQEDLANKLMSLIDKNKDTKQVEFVKKIGAFVDENRQNEFIDCKDTEADVPCVFLKLNDGMFWHRTSVDYCEITQAKMSNCGAASDPTGMLYNLMSNEGGTTKYYITLEYSKSKNKVIQVLGKANTMPKEKYWPAITSFFKAMGDPLLSKDAFMHMYEDDDNIESKKEVDKKIAEFIEGIGASMIPPPAIESWESMKTQIRSAYYRNMIEQQPFEGSLRNLFRAVITHGKDDGNKTTLMLGVKMIVQTITNEVYARTSLTDLNDMFKREGKKLEEYAKSGELKKEIYEAIPEKYVDPAREIHLKYSKSSNVRVGMGSNGSIRIGMNFFFDVRNSPWTEARGEYLAENFQQLTEGITSNLERAGLAAVFEIVPDRAASVYPEEAKRRGDVDDILRDMGFNEGKKKQKLDRNYLTSTVTEVINESLSAMFTSVEFAKQALELAMESGMIPKPSKMKETVFDTIQIHFNTHEELKQFMDFLEDQGIPRQTGISNIKRPTYFVFKSFAGDLPTALTLKL